MTGNVGGLARPNALLDDLRNGERDAFVRFYEQYRLPVYSFVARLIGGFDDAAAITREVFVRAFRETILNGGPTDLKPWVYKLAVEACEDHVGALGEDNLRRDTSQSAEESSRPDEYDRIGLGHRFEQILLELSVRQRAALVLTDVHGLRIDETAAVLGVPSEAMKALLFRAGEEFRRAFDALSRGRHDETCRLAEQAAVSSVGRGAPLDNARRLRKHAGYCRPCREVMESWTAGAAGLALCLTDVSLPEALQAPPVFGAAPADASSLMPRRAAVAGAVGATSTFAYVLARAGRALASKATAYAVAAICLAAFAGMALYVSHHDWRQIIVRTVRSAPTAVAPQAGQVAKPAISTTKPRVTSTPSRVAVVRVPSAAVSQPVVRVASRQAAGVRTAVVRTGATNSGTTVASIDKPKPVVGAPGGSGPKLLTSAAVAASHESYAHGETKVAQLLATRVVRHPVAKTTTHHALGSARPVVTRHDSRAKVTTPSSAAVAASHESYTHGETKAAQLLATRAARRPVAKTTTHHALGSATPGATIHDSGASAATLSSATGDAHASWNDRPATGSTHARGSERHHHDRGGRHGGRAHHQ